MAARTFRDCLRPVDDPRIAGIAQMDAYSWAARALANPRAMTLFGPWLERYRTQDFFGITTDGKRIPGLYSLAVEDAPGAAIAAAVESLLRLATDAERRTFCYPVDAREWRGWMNPEVYLHRHGLRLDEIRPALRDAVLEVLRASMSPRGYDKARGLMRINHFLGELVKAPRVMNEYSYNFNLFGTPSATGPWGWNFHGHHLCLNCLVIGGQMSFTPVFMGAEPNCIDAGPHARLAVLDDVEGLGLDLMRSLPPALRRRAQLFEKKRDPSMPQERVAIGDELLLGGAFQDNRVIPYEGVPAADFSAVERKRLVDLVAAYLSYLPAGAFEARMAEFERHLSATHFCWIGGSADDSPFYYRIQSPVLMVEFDHHAGVFLGNADPEKFHIHTLVRTPNGNDYGMDLVRQHCERA